MARSDTFIRQCGRSVFSRSGAKRTRAVEQAARDPQFQAQAASYFAPLRYLPPADYEAELREAEAGFRKMWQEIPWGEK